MAIADVARRGKNLGATAKQLLISDGNKQRQATMSTQFSILGVPIDCLGFDGPPQGTELSPNALRALGIVERLGAIDLGDVDVRISAQGRDDQWGIVSHRSVVETTGKLRARVRSLHAEGRKLLVLGGCCTQMMGVLAGARDAFGKVGIAYADGHLDLYDGQSSPTGEAADIPLAVLTGRGPVPLLRATGPGPVLDPTQAFLVGYRDEEEARAAGSLLPQDLGPGFNHLGLDALRAEGMARGGARIARTLERTSDRFWLHIDLDILADRVFPATDYLMPGGLTWEELDALIQPIGQSPGLIGMAVACYNPTKDPAGIHGKRLITHLQRVLCR